MKNLTSYPMVVARIKELIMIINQYNNSYFNYNKNEVSDFEYDKIFEELKFLENKYNIIYANSPTQNVGCEVKSDLKKVKHNHPMLSLAKTKSVNEISDFLGDKAGVLMLKMDGVTCSCRYVNGVLVSAETRGNGEIGEDILHNAKMFDNLPLTIPCKDEVVVDGEAIITYASFNKINDVLSDNEKYKNPRNLVSGSVRQLDSNIAKERHVEFIAWKLIKGNNESNSFIDNLHWLERQGFDVVLFTIVNYNGMVFTHDKYTDIESGIEYLKEYAVAFGYPIDGIVAGFDDIKYGENLGRTEHHLNSQIAYKFYDELYETKVTGINWTLGKTGQITPVAEFEPVEIDGTIVENASLHNVKIFKDYDLHYNDTISVYKANAIIPQIAYNLDYNKDRSDNLRFKIPTQCPVCGGNVRIDNDGNSEFLVCTNPECKGKLLYKLIHFASRDAMDIRGLSEATLMYLIDNVIVNNYVDLYTLKHKKHFIEDWKSENGYGEKSVNKILDAIEKSKNTTLDKFIYSLSIPMIGKSKSKTISNYFNGEWDKFFDMAIINKFDFSELDDFGYVASDSIKNYLANNKIAILNLASHMNFKTGSNSKSNVLKGQTFVITGSLSTYKNRDELKNIIENNGGKVAGSVSSKTSYLINNDVSSTSGKNKKALELNVPIISEEEFNNMIT